MKFQRAWVELMSEHQSRLTLSSKLQNGILSPPPFYLQLEHFERFPDITKLEGVEEFTTSLYFPRSGLELSD